MNTLIQTIEHLLSEALLSDIAITFAPPLDVEGNLVNPQQKVLNLVMDEDNNQIDIEKYDSLKDVWYGEPKLYCSDTWEDFERDYPKIRTRLWGPNDAHIFKRYIDTYGCLEIRESRYKDKENR